MTLEQRVSLTNWMVEVSHALNRLSHFTDPTYAQAMNTIFDHLRQFENACANEPQSLREHANEALKPVTHLDCVGTEGGKATTTTLKP